MAICSECGPGVAHPATETFCPVHGKKLENEAPGPAAVTAQIVNPVQGGFVMATSGKRFLAFFLDQLLITAIVLVGMIPGINFGSFALAFAYALMRDFWGASVGKLAVGLQVLDQSGKPASRGQCVARNIIFCLSVFGLLIPVLGAFLTEGLDLALCLIEAVIVLVAKRRIGDHIAGTVVVQQ